MARKRFILVKVAIDEQPDKLSHLQAFLHNYQTAMLLALLKRGLLTQRQFEQCAEELQKQSRNDER